MELIYIRTLEVSPEALLTYVCIIAAELACIFIIRRISRTSTVYASAVLATDGYYINGSGVHANNMHYVKRPCYVLPVILYGFLLLCACAGAIVPFRTVQYDLIQYLYIHVLVCSTVLGQLIVSINHAKRARVHFERLVLVDICLVIGDPTQSILVFTDRHGWIYEYFTSDPYAWTAGDYFNATCYGESILEIDTTPKPQKFFGFQVLCTHLMCAYKLAPIVLTITGLILCLIDISSGVIPVCVAIITIPRKHKIKIYITGKHLTAEYQDMNYNYKYVFCGIDKNSNTYYYFTDDEKALNIGVCYDCTVKAGIVDMVWQESDKQVVYWYVHSQSILICNVLYLYLFASMFVLHVLDLTVVAYAVELLAVVLLAKTIKYSNRGDI